MCGGTCSGLRQFVVKRYWLSLACLATGDEFFWPGPGPLVVEVVALGA
jgi:hypothetical protein